jgi:hypothetical protein
VSAHAEPVGTTRGVALKRAVLLAAGAIGIGAAGRASVGDGGPLPGEPFDLTLHAPELRVATPDRGPGRVPQPGDRFHTRAELYAGPDGARRGELLGSGVAFDLSIGARDHEQHTFVLDDGTILGMGLSGEDGTYSVVGGTGRYADARGGYTIRRDASGAAFIFKLRR